MRSSYCVGCPVVVASLRVGGGLFSPPCRVVGLRPRV